MRHSFPSAGDTFAGSTSDGYRLQLLFAAGRLTKSFSLLTAFLAENGYQDIPLPENLEELKQFRQPPKFRHQLGLFGDDGYTHNPIKILFPPSGGRKGSLLLEIYNETYPGHLLKFHGRKLS
ncbi:MAG: hypothetical protein HC821_04485 [Lewinella sp.]|nr:hypothetical protein [Lewinella sp.]